MLLRSNRTTLLHPLPSRRLTSTEAPPVSRRVARCWYLRAATAAWCSLLLQHVVGVLWFAVVRGRMRTELRRGAAGRRRPAVAAGAGGTMGSMWMQVGVNSRVVYTRYPSQVPAGTYGPDLMTGGLTWQQVRSREAHHEAGHAAVGMALGLPVTAVHLYAAPDAVPGLGATDGMAHLGHTALGPFDADVRSVLVFLAAGVRAAHRWLAEQELLTPRTAFFNDVLGSAGDQARMAMLTTARPAHFTWGADQVSDVPPGHDHIEMASLYDQADDLVRDCWAHTTAIAHHLLAQGNADANTLRRLHRVQSPAAPGDGPQPWRTGTGAAR
ncbi:hypothetical protein [Streptacidiphilus sp. EB103A]|uniref:hypothetical protein n=1 Tax=Streptacidiphilus sp. EB103A TaxID=3156275 RepID=UPI003516E671